MKAYFPVFFAAPLVSMTACTGTPCASFESFATGTEFQTGETIASDGYSFPVRAFQASNAATPVSGTAIVEQRGDSPVAMGVTLRSAALEVPIAGTVDSVRFRFVDTGAHSSLTLNGFIMGWGNLANLSGSSFGPGGLVHVDVAQEKAPTGTRWVGTMTVAGPMASVSIGGEELWIDEICVRADDCGAELVDNGTLRFASRQDVAVTHERRYHPLRRMGHRPYRMLAVSLARGAVAAGVTLTVRASVIRTNDPQNLLVTSTSSVTGPVDAGPLAVPLEFLFPQYAQFQVPAPDDYSLMVEIEAVGGAAQVETVAPRTFPWCEALGRFSFLRANRAPGNSFAFQPSDAFHLLLLGRCE